MTATIPNFFKYPINSERDRDWQIYCTVAGFTDVPPNSPYPMLQHPSSYHNFELGRVLQEYQVIYITSGKGQYKSKNIKRMIHPGTIIMLFPGVKHWYHPTKEEGWHEYYVGFKGPYAEALQANKFINPMNPIYQIGHDDFILRQFLNIFEFIQKEAPGFHQQVSASISQIIAKIYSWMLNQDQDSENLKIVVKMKYRFEENIFSDLDMEAFAKEFNMAYSKLRTIFKEVTNLSPYNYFLDLKINKAKVMLQEGDTLIKEIAYKLAFQNEYYFSRLFKKKTGLSPSAWRLSSQFQYDGN